MWTLIFPGGEGTYHLKVLVPGVAAGAIIGKGGETIAQLQKDTGARVKMSKSHDFYPGEYSTQTAFDNQWQHKKSFACMHIANYCNRGADVILSLPGRPWSAVISRRPMRTHARSYIIHN